MAKLWPQPSDESQLTKLIASSHDKACQAILHHIVTVRQQSYDRTSSDNPDEYAGVGKVVTSLDQNQSSLNLLTVLVEVSHSHSHELAFEIVKRIAEFLSGEQARSSNSADPRAREWACELLNGTDESRRSMFFLLEKGELGLLRWLVRNCGADRVEEWLYSAVWVDRVDVLGWLWTQWSRICDLRRSRAAAKLDSSRRRTMFHSLGASFSTVRQRFEMELSRISSRMSEDEYTAYWGNFAYSTVTTNMVDFAAVNGHCFTLHDLVQRDPHVRSTVSGLFGAIARGHLEVVRFLYRHQLEFSNWPSPQDARDVLSFLLDQGDISMLTFFRQKKNMRLRAADLVAAVWCVDVGRVRLICELDLVDWVDLTAEVMDIAAVRGSLEILKMIHAKVGSLLCSSRAMDGAAEEGHSLVVEYLDANDATCSRSAVDLAARNGHADVVQYLLANRFEGGSPYSLLWATANGHADVARCLLSKHFRFDVDLCLSVARQQRYVSIVDLFEVHRSEFKDGALKWSSASNRRRRA